MQIYFAGATGKIKVGISRNPPARMKQLSRTEGSIWCIGTIKGNLAREREIHKALSRYRITGEWYRDCPEVRAVIQNCFNNFELADGRAVRSGKFGLVCKALWPHKTAEELAARVGCAVRTAAYEISGEREASRRSIAVVIAEMLA